MMIAYLLITRWTESDGTTFKREHRRFASSRNMAIALERAHNRDRLDTMDEGEVWRSRVVRCVELSKVPTDPKVPHQTDGDCILDSFGSCVLCGVVHGDPCASCQGRGFHNPRCASELDDDHPQPAIGGRL